MNLRTNKWGRVGTNAQTPRFVILSEHSFQEDKIL